MATLKASDILREHNLRLTDGRREILDIIRGSRFALSHHEVFHKLSIAVDRITTYRTLLLFKEKGIVHSVIDPDCGVSKYIFSDKRFPIHHAHFKCTECGGVSCLAIEVDDVNTMILPGKYKALQYAFVIEGLCPRCNE